MSLVSEALRKARAESLAGGGSPRGVVFRTTVVLGARGPRIGLGWLLGGVALAAVAAGGAVTWWLLSGRGGAPPAPVPTSAAAARPAARPLAPTPADASPPAPGSPAAAAPPATVEAAAGRPAALRPAPVPTDNAAAATAPPARAPEAAKPRSSPVAPAQERPEPAPDAARQAAATAASGARERAFGLDADLGYAKFHLDFIVYRSKAPFAGINGQQVTIGSVIEGFTVEEIGPDDVRLRDPKGPVVLRIP